MLAKVSSGTPRCEVCVVQRAAVFSAFLLNRMDARVHILVA
jgi:hypothetical protein